MRNCFIRTSKVSSQCKVHISWVTRVSKIMWTKTFNHFCVLLCHMGFHRNTVTCLKIVTSLNKSRDCSIMSIYSTVSFNNAADKTCNHHKAFLCSFRPYGLPLEHCGLPINCFFIKSKTRYFSIMSIYNTTFFHIRLWE